MIIALYITLAWLLFGTLFFIASYYYCRDLMPPSLVVGFLVSQLVWPGFLITMIKDGMEWLVERFK